LQYVQFISEAGCIMNERITENIVRNLLREKLYYSDDNIIIEEQKSQNHE
jgi:hypothetical protein